MTSFNIVLSGPCFASTARGYNSVGRGESKQKRDCTSERRVVVRMVGCNSHITDVVLKKYQLQKMKQKVIASFYVGF